jgi:putative endonuclease
MIAYAEFGIPSRSRCASLVFGAAPTSPTLCNRLSVAPPKHFVYVLQSTVQAERYYSGLTCDVATRLGIHNSGGSQHTAGLRPWRLVVALEFATEASAVAFQKYLKTGSGRAFAKRHFV